MCSYEDKAVLGHPLTKWEGGIYSGERKTAVGDTLSHTGFGHPAVHRCPGVHKGSDVRQVSVVQGL